MAVQKLLETRGTTTSATGGQECSRTVVTQSLKEQYQSSYETLRSTATALQGPKNLPSQVRPR